MAAFEDEYLAIRCEFAVGHLDGDTPPTMLTDRELVIDTVSWAHVC